MFNNAFSEQDMLSKILLENYLLTEFKHLKHHPLYKRFNTVTEIGMVKEAFQEIYPKESKRHIMKQAALHLGEEMAKVTEDIRLNPNKYSADEIEAMYDAASQKDWAKYDKTKSTV